MLVCSKILIRQVLDLKQMRGSNKEQHTCWVAAKLLLLFVVVGILVVHVVVVACVCIVVCGVWCPPFFFRLSSSLFPLPSAVLVPALFLSLYFSTSLSRLDFASRSPPIIAICFSLPIRAPFFWFPSPSTGRERREGHKVQTIPQAANAMHVPVPLDLCFFF